MKRKTLLKISSLILVFALVGNVWSGEAESENSSRCGSGPGFPNPADIYCLELGYQLDAVEGEDVCVFPDGSSCDSWRFLEGQCGQRYSYCAKNGYGQITKTDGNNPFSPHYAVCVDSRTKAEVGSVTKLMGLSERCARSIIEEELLLPLKPSPPEERLLAPAAVPTSFDWRNHNGQDWMTAVHNQRACGSCWAFSAVGTTEAVYNIYTNFPDLDLDLSEEFLNSDCPSPNPGSCCGGGHTRALNIIRDDGIPDEDCLPYDEGYYSTGECRCFPNPPCNPKCDGLPASCSHLNCSDACADMASRLVTIDSYHYVAAAQIKQNLVDEGPLAVCLAMSGTYDAQNVYRCTTCWDRDGDSECDPDNGVCVIPSGQTEGTCGGVGRLCKMDADCDEDRNGDGVCDQDDCGTNHCVIIVGYDDAGGYWIVKNSWGNTWRGDGYWEVGYGECHIEDYVYYVEPADINFPPIADANGPYSAECQGATIAVLLDGTGSNDPNADDTLTYSWTTNCPGGSFDDDTSATPILTLNTSASAVCPLTCDVTLTVSDGEESDTDTASVTVEDTTAPVLSGVPGDETVECDAVPPPASVTVTDDCDPDPTVDFSETRTDGSCLNSYTLIRTWTATDACGNSSSSDQILTVEDTTAPVIECNARRTITPPDAPISFRATAADNCDDDPSVLITGFDCFKFTKNGKKIDKKQSCRVGVAGDSITIRNTGGVGTHITWNVRAVDNCGNVTERECEVEVVRPGRGSKGR